MTEPAYAECVSKTDDGIITFSGRRGHKYKCVGKSDLVIRIKSSQDMSEYYPSKGEMDWSSVSKIMVVSKGSEPDSVEDAPSFDMKLCLESGGAKNEKGNDDEWCMKKPTLIKDQVSGICQALQLLITDQNLLIEAMEKECPFIMVSHV